MMDYKKLVEALRICANTAFCNECPLDDTCDNANKLQLDAADAIEALQAETEYHFEHDAVEIDDIDKAPTVEPACTWHRVEEPPKVGQNVLTMDANEDMETAIYDGECFEDSYGFYVTDVLYWMPIEPPKEDA